MGKMSPKIFAKHLNDEFDRNISDKEVAKAWHKMGLTELDENNHPVLTEKGISRGGQITGTGFSLSFDYDELKQEVMDRINLKKKR